MAQKTITDSGPTETIIAITRETLDGVAVFHADVVIKTSDGTKRAALDSAALAALIPAGANRTAFIARLTEIYNAALASLGFA